MTMIPLKIHIHCVIWDNPKSAAVSIIGLTKLTHVSVEFGDFTYHLTTEGWYVGSLNRYTVRTYQVWIDDTLVVPRLSFALSTPPLRVFDLLCLTTCVTKRLQKGWVCTDFPSYLMDGHTRPRGRSVQEFEKWLLDFCDMNRVPCVVLKTTPPCGGTMN